MRKLASPLLALKPPLKRNRLLQIREPCPINGPNPKRKTRLARLPLTKPRAVKTFPTTAPRNKWPVKNRSRHNRPNQRPK